MEAAQRAVDAPAGVEPAAFVTDLIPYYLKLEEKRLFTYLTDHETLRYRRYRRVFERLLFRHLSVDPGEEILLPLAISICLKGEAFEMLGKSLAVGVNAMAIPAVEVPEANEVALELPKKAGTLHVHVLNKGKAEGATYFQLVDTTLKEKHQLFKCLQKEFAEEVLGLLAVLPKAGQAEFLMRTCGLSLGAEWRRLYVTFFQFQQQSRELLLGHSSTTDYKRWLHGYFALLSTLFGVRMSPLLEKRRTFRVPLTVPATITFTDPSGADGELLTYCKDLGIDGASFGLLRSFQYRNLIGVSLHFPEGDIDCKAAVSWMTADGFGAAFEDLAKKRKERLFEAIFGALKELVYLQGIAAEVPLAKPGQGSLPPRR